MADGSMLAVFEPEIMGGAMKMAEQLARSTLIPKALQSKPGDVLVVLLTGREFGLGPMQSLRGIHVVDGKAVMAADLMVGLCVGRRDVCEFFTLVESTDKKATYRAKRVGPSEAVTLSWTWEQAQGAGLTGKQNWRNYPAAMLRARCASALARAVFPDLLNGTYDPDEIGEHAPPPPSEPVTRAPALPSVSATREAAPTLERVPEKVPVVVFGGAAAGATVDAQPAPVAQREPGSDDGEEDEMAREGRIIVERASAVTSEAERLVLCQRAALLPKGSPERKAAGEALNAAKRRLVQGGGK